MSKSSRSQGSSRDSAPRASSASNPNGFWNRFFRRLGPGLITACVVIGPGSLLTSSSVGSVYGYQTIWVLFVAVGLMMVFMTMGAKLGVTADGTPAELLSRHVGRWLPALIGIAVFCIAASYQYGNNLGAASAIEPLLSFASAASRPAWVIGATGLLNAAAIAFLFAFKDLYVRLERVMATFVAIMLTAFVINLIIAGIDLRALALGLIPSVPHDPSGKPLDPLPVIGWIGTTFITAIAYYQAYLVRQKGWSREQLKDGIWDARVGALVVASITLMITVTAAQVLAPKVAEGFVLSNIAQVGEQLRPSFGAASQWIFSAGVFCAAYSSFLINSMIGGFLLADGFFLNATSNDRLARRFTAAILVIGWLVAAAVIILKIKPVAAIVFAQALTVPIAPLVGIVLWWLTSRRDVMGEERNRWPTHVVAATGLLVLLALSILLLHRIASSLGWV